jgi:hypothetical protein
VVNRLTGQLGTATAVAVCVAGVLAAGILERRSLEHANRLHRDGDLQAAARAYADAATRAGGDSSALTLYYNFGTTLLELGSPAAPRELARATGADDPVRRARALYNVGLFNLHRARDVVAADSVTAYASVSADANKAVLRLEPGRADARWNLALAQRLLDSINADDGRSGTESVEGTEDTDERVLSEELREFEDPSEVNDAPRDGSDEALAQAVDAAVLSPLDADAILVSDPDRSIIVRKLLAFQGRLQRRPFGGRSGPRW